MDNGLLTNNIQGIYYQAFVKLLEIYLEKVSGKTSSTGNGTFSEIIEAAASKYKVDPDLVEAIVKVESGGNPNAESPAGAQGLMQLMPETAASLGVSNSFDPVQNIEGGVRYLSQLLNYYGGDITKALAGYNAGPGAVDEYNGVPPYKETRSYIQRVLSAYAATQNNGRV
jgi:soluble lytic murein transglycosylase-like protein